MQVECDFIFLIEDINDVCVYFFICYNFKNRLMYLMIFYIILKVKNK